MAITAAQVSVTTTATALNTANSYTWTDIRLTVPSGGQTVFLGASDVTATTGGSVLAGTSADIRVPPGQVLYGIVAATTQTTHVLRTSG